MLILKQFWESPESNSRHADGKRIRKLRFHSNFAAHIATHIATVGIWSKPEKKNTNCSDFFVLES